MYQAYISLQIAEFLSLKCNPESDRDKKDKNLAFLQPGSIR